MICKSIPTGPLLTAIPALSLTLTSSLSGNITLASCQHLQKLRLCSDYARTRDKFGINTKPAVFAPQASSSWADRLLFLDAQDYAIRQEVSMPALTHLTCSLPEGESLSPSKFPALQVLPRSANRHAQIKLCRAVNVKSQAATTAACLHLAPS